jgi:Metalloenzyme superfamily
VESRASLNVGVPRPAAWALFLLVSWSCVAQPPRRIDPPRGSTATATTEATAAPRTGAPPEASPSAVVLVVLDGVRWQEIFEGVDPQIARRQGLTREEIVDASALMPTLHDVLVEHGIAVGAPGHGPEMRATGPNYVSLPGYTEILTGRTATSCGDNACQRVPLPTLADELAPREPASGDASAVFASWESLDRAASSGSGDVVVSAGRHAGRGLEALRADETERALLEDAARASPLPGEADFRPDRYTADIALRYLVTRAPRFLFIGLGEPDEYAHQDNYRGYLESLRAADRTLGRLVDALAYMGERGKRTSIFVTTDHGRAASFRDHGGFAPESGRVWLVASGAGVAQRGLARSHEPRRLADIAPTMRALLGVAPDAREDAGRVIEEALAAR